MFLQSLLVMGDMVPQGSLFWNFAVSESAEQESLFRRIAQSQTYGAHFCSLWARCPVWRQHVLALGHARGGIRWLWGVG